MESTMLRRTVLKRVSQYRESCNRFSEVDIRYLMYKSQFAGQVTNHTVNTFGFLGFLIF